LSPERSSMSRHPEPRRRRRISHCANEILRCAQDDGLTAASAGEMPDVRERLRYTVTGPAREQPPPRKRLEALNVRFTRIARTADHLRDHPGGVRRRKAPATWQRSRRRHLQLPRRAQRARRQENPGHHRREEERLIGWSDQPWRRSHPNPPPLCTRPTSLRLRFRKSWSRSTNIVRPDAS